MTIVLLFTARRRLQWKRQDFCEEFEWSFLKNVLLAWNLIHKHVDPFTRLTFK